MPRSLALYIAASSVYAALVFLAVHATYGIELGRSGVYLPDPTALLSSIDTVSFAIWLGLSLIAATVLYGLARALEGARDEGQQRQGEIASIFALGQALSGSLELDDIAERFVATARGSLDPSVTAALYISDDAVEGFRLVREGGPHTERLGAASYSATTLPAPIRTRVVDHQQPLVVTDAMANPAWPALAGGLRDPAWVRAFAAIPLVSHDRLVGLALFASARVGSISPDTLQIVVLGTQFVAAAVRTSLTFAEAEARANREALVNRVAQRARASLDPDLVLRVTVEELGRTLDVMRVVASVGSRPDDLRVAHEWNAKGVLPLGAGSHELPAARQAAATGHTAQVTDDMSRLATPIIIGGELAGTLGLQADRTRSWSVHDVRLVEAVARELRVSMEAARLFQSRQRENERLLALQRASAVVAARSTTREVIDEILRTASSLLGQASASLYLWDEAEGGLRLTQNADPSGRRVGVFLSRGTGGLGDLLARLEPAVVNDYPTWSAATPNGIANGLQAVLGLSLFGDQAVAALTNAEAFERQRAAMEQLERVNRAKSEFVSIVSHEFRTPLTGIQGFSEMMKDEDLTIAEMKEYAADINKDAQRLNRMITEMLDLDRMEAGRMTLHREPADLNAIVSEAADRVRPNAPEHPISLRLDVALPALSADRDKLTQVVANLLSNAVKYSPTGGEIVVVTSRDGTSAHLTVSDHGMGIPVDRLESIWERYSRIETDKTRGIQGTGLGLPIVRQIVTMHGGKVWAESMIGRGSTFHVVLPLAASEQAVQA